MTNDGHTFKLHWDGMPVGAAPGAVIFLHGRGATAEGMLPLGDALSLKHLAWVAPQASRQTWYPFSFMAPLEANEPWLSSALEVVARTVHAVEAQRIPRHRIHVCGFSQGACLASEFLLRHPARFASALLFTGGMIGPEGLVRKYYGDFGGTPVLLSTGDPDPHVPLQRVQETADAMRELGAQVTLRMHSGKPHTISIEELDEARAFLSSALGSL